MIDVNGLRARIKAAEQAFKQLEADYTQHYDFDWRDYDGSVEDIDNWIAGAKAMLEQFEALMVEARQIATDAGDMVNAARAESERAEAVLNDAEDAASDADMLDTGEFERDGLSVVIDELTVRRREVAAGEGDKGVPHHRLCRKDRRAVSAAGKQRRHRMSIKALRDEARAMIDDADEAALRRFVSAGKAAREGQRKSLMSVLDTLSTVVATLGFSAAAYHLVTGENPFDALERLRARIMDKVSEWRSSGDDDKVQQAEQALELIDEAEEAAREEQDEGDKSARRHATKSTSAHRLYA